MTTMISIARSFSVYPGGRSRDDGPASGEEFLENFLVPAMKKGEPFIVNLDDTKGYGSSFLEEAFGGLVRKGFTKKQIKDLMTIFSSDKSLIDEIYLYIDEESSRSALFKR